MADNTFDPDAYLAAKTAAPVSDTSNFDPDTYLAAAKGSAYTPEVDKDPTGANSMALERSDQYPNAKMTDATVPDLMMVDGLGGLAKAGAGGALRATGAALNAIPATENIVPAIGDTADDMLLKGLGTRAGQIKQVGGLEAARDAAKVGREAGLDNFWSTERGRMADLKNLTQQQGQQIGALRAQAGQASPNILDQVKQQLMAKYNPEAGDVFSGEAPQVEKGINTIRNASGDAGQTNAGIAKGITALNKYATGAKQLQPVNALTDVANNASQINNAEIAQKLGPEGNATYQNALRNESGAFHLQPFLEKGAEREAVARGGGKGIIQSLAQKAADAGGYRAASKGLNALQGSLNQGPAVTPAVQSALEAYLAKQKNDELSQ